MWLPHSRDSPGMSTALPPAFFRRGFFSASACARLCETLSRLHAEPAVVSSGDGVRRLDRDARRTKTAHIDQALRTRLTRRVELLRESLEDHFGERLGDCQPPQLLRYDTGDFFRPHFDSAGYDPRQPPRIVSRRVALVVFLNDSFRGGNLHLYCLSETPTWRDFCFRVEPETGLAVAFRADVVHEVTRVRSGVRYSLVTWFTSPKASRARAGA